jgi:hypothetical protein
MKFNIEGRMRNMRLPDGRTALLFAVYEAVSNGVHAIEERFGNEQAATSGHISIFVKTDAKKQLNLLSIRDNGVGLNGNRLDSFETSDTLAKASMGGRGVGRLIWVKAFEEINVKSGFETEPGCHELVSFRFEPTSEISLAGLVRRRATAEDVGTYIELTSVRPQHVAKLTMTFLARSLCHHFFPYFISGSMPRLTITLGRHSVDLGQYLQSRMSAEATEIVDLSADGVGKVEVTHVYVDPKIARELSNSILLTAQGRVVESLEIEKKFALRDLENRQAYACTVKSTFLDDKADQERTSFKALPAHIQAIKEAALEAAERFLGAHIVRMRVAQKKLLVDLLEENPQLAVSVADVDAYVQKLGASPD